MRVAILVLLLAMVFALLSDRADAQRRPRPTRSPTTARPTRLPTPKATKPTNKPTPNSQTAKPTSTPTNTPTNTPSASPTTKTPTSTPTSTPTNAPTTAPTFPGLNDETIRTAVQNWCTGGDPQTNAENAYGKIQDWDVSRVTTMAGLFRDQTTCNPPIGNWNTANVKDVNAMFEFARAFNQPIGNWNTAAVTNMVSMLFCARDQPEAVLDPPHKGRADAKHVFSFRVLPELLLPTRHVRV